VRNNLVEEELVFQLLEEERKNEKDNGAEEDNN
jgi:hypothetical protein